MNLARLIVEATLRFDRFSACINGQPGRNRDDLVFYHVDNNMQSPSRYLPFLKVRMEGENPGDSSPNTRYSSDNNNSRKPSKESVREGRRSVLANVGHLLLQLGLKRSIQWDLRVVERGLMMSEIQKLCSELERNCLADLAAVSRHCFEMCDGKNNDDGGDEEFYKWYCYNIVYPLKLLDENLKRDAEY